MVEGSWSLGAAAAQGGGTEAQDPRVGGSQRAHGHRGAEAPKVTLNLLQFLPDSHGDVNFPSKESTESLLHVTRVLLWWPYFSVITLRYRWSHQIDVFPLLNAVKASGMHP